MQQNPDLTTVAVTGMVSLVLLGLGAGTFYCAKWVGLKAVSPAEQCSTGSSPRPPSLTMDDDIVGQSRLSTPEQVKEALMVSPTPAQEPMPSTEFDEELLGGSRTRHLAPQIDSLGLNDQFVVHRPDCPAGFFFPVTDFLNDLHNDPNEVNEHYLACIQTLCSKTTERVISDLISRSDLLQGSQAQTYLGELLQKAATSVPWEGLPLPGSAECFLAAYALNILATLSPVYKVGAIRTLIVLLERL